MKIIVSRIQRRVSDPAGFTLFVEGQPSDREALERALAESGGRVVMRLHHETPRDTDAETLLREEGWVPSPARLGWWRDSEASGEDYPETRAVALARRDRKARAA